VVCNGRPHGRLQVPGAGGRVWAQNKVACGIILHAYGIFDCHSSPCISIIVTKAAFSTQIRRVKWPL
jgi:hypothetical protein